MEPFRTPLVSATAVTVAERAPTSRTRRPRRRTAQTASRSRIPPPIGTNRGCRIAKPAITVLMHRTPAIPPIRPLTFRQFLATIDLTNWPGAPHDSPSILLRRKPSALLRRKTSAIRGGSRRDALASANFLGRDRTPGPRSLRPLDHGETLVGSSRGGKPPSPNSQPGATGGGRPQQDRGLPLPAFSGGKGGKADPCSPSFQGLSRSHRADET